jgi:hypothetical protein
VSYGRMPGLQGARTLGTVEQGGLREWGMEKMPGLWRHASESSEMPKEDIKTWLVHPHPMEKTVQSVEDFLEVPKPSVWPLPRISHRVNGQGKNDRGKGWLRIAVCSLFCQGKDRWGDF